MKGENAVRSLWPAHEESCRADVKDSGVGFLPSVAENYSLKNSSWTLLAPSRLCVPAEGTPREVPHVLGPVVALTHKVAAATRCTWTRHS